MGIGPRAQIHKMPPWRLTATDDDHVVFTTNLTHALTFTRGEILIARTNAEEFSQLVDRKKATLLQSLDAILGCSVADVTQEALHA